MRQIPTRAMSTMYLEWALEWSFRRKGAKEYTEREDRVERVRLLLVLDFPSAGVNIVSDSTGRRDDYLDMELAHIFQLLSKSTSPCS
jgi:hypothetical protein